MKETTKEKVILKGTLTVVIGTHRIGTTATIITDAIDNTKAKKTYQQTLCISPKPYLNDKRNKDTTEDRPNPYHNP